MRLVVTVVLCVLLGAIFSKSANAKLIISIYDQNSEEASVLGYEGHPKYWSEVIQTDIVKPGYIQSKHYVVSEPNSIPLVVTTMMLLMLIKRKYG